MKIKFIIKNLGMMMMMMIIIIMMIMMDDDSDVYKYDDDDALCNEMISRNTLYCILSNTHEM